MAHVYTMTILMNDTSLNQVVCVSERYVVSVPVLLFSFLDNQCCQYKDSCEELSVHVCVNCQYVNVAGEHNCYKCLLSEEDRKSVV